MMKRFLFLSIALCFMALANAADRNSLAMGDISINVGQKTAQLPIRLNNLDKISDLQFDLTLPEGLSVATSDDGNPIISKSATRFTSSHDVSGKLQSSGAYRVVCTSISETPFVGNTGDVFYITLSVAEDIAVGDYTTAISNVVLSHKDALYRPQGAVAAITVQKLAQLVFKIDDEIVMSESVVVGSPIQAPSVEPREGYTFSGWGDVPDVMPDEDLTFTATFTANTYTATFNLDGEFFAELKFQYGAPIVPPTVPEKEGYSFSGWEFLPEKMPATDQIYDGYYDWIHIAGDVNDDGKINTLDVVYVYNFILVGNKSGVTKEQADVNEDSKVDASDVVSLYNIILGE